MKTPINYQIIKDSNGNPAFAVLPFAELQRLLHPINTETGVPAKVVDLMFDNDWSALRAWREYLGLTQSEVANRMGITQAAYSQHENSRSLRKSTRTKIAAALNLHIEQLDF